MSPGYPATILTADPSEADQQVQIDFTVRLMERQHSCRPTQSFICGLWLIIFRTTDTSFVENPPTSSKSAPKFATPAPASRIGGAGRGAAGPAGRGGAARGGLRGTRGSGLARAAKGRGAK